MESIAILLTQQRGARSVGPLSCAHASALHKSEVLSDESLLPHRSLLRHASKGWLLRQTPRYWDITLLRESLLGTVHRVLRRDLAAWRWAFCGGTVPLSLEPNSGPEASHFLVPHCFLCHKPTQGESGTGHKRQQNTNSSMFSPVMHLSVAMSIRVTLQPL